MICNFFTLSLPHSYLSPRILCPGSVRGSTKLIQVSFKEFRVRQEYFNLVSEYIIAAFFFLVKELKQSNNDSPEFLVQSAYTTVV